MLILPLENKVDIEVGPHNPFFEGDPRWLNATKLSTKGNLRYLATMSLPTTISISLPYHLFEALQVRSMLLLLGRLPVISAPIIECPVVERILFVYFQVSLGTPPMGESHLYGSSHFYPSIVISIDSHLRVSINILAYEPPKPLIEF